MFSSRPFLCDDGSDLHTKTSISCVFNILTAIQQSSKTSKSNARFSYSSAFSPVLSQGIHYIQAKRTDPWVMSKNVSIY